LLQLHNINYSTRPKKMVLEAIYVVRHGVSLAFFFNF
jgi:hypothetical protein